MARFAFSPVALVPFIVAEMPTQPPPPTIREGWEMPPPPPGGPWEPLAFVLGGADGVMLYWIPADCDDVGDTEYTDETAISWPFGDDDVARFADFEALGFRVES